jgi:hypothetical protein
LVELGCMCYSYDIKVALKSVALNVQCSHSC